MRELMKQPRPADSLAICFFVLAVFYTIVCGSAHTVLMGIGFTLVVLGALPKHVALAFLVGASAIMLVQTDRRQWHEGFESGSKKEGSDAPTIDEDPAAAEVSKKEQEEDKEEAVDELLHGRMAEGFNDKKKVLLPDNADRKEPLELGKPYKLPKESDDKGYHLDSGTTFLNAYKALKPDQIAAMTKDTQELLATQKSLVGMLESFGPLMKDMDKITGFFGTSN